MAIIFGGTKFFFKSGSATHQNYPMENFFSGRHFWRVNYLLNLERLVFTDILWVKTFAEIPLVNFYFMKKMV